MIMVDAHIHRILVVADQNRLQGIVTSTDILAAVARAAQKAGLETGKWLTIPGNRLTFRCGAVPDVRPGIDPLPKPQPQGGDCGAAGLAPRRKDRRRRPGRRLRGGVFSIAQHRSRPASVRPGR